MKKTRVLPLATLPMPSAVPQPRIFWLLASLWLALLLAWPAAHLHAQALARTFAGGINHSLSIHADGTLWATGSNQYGQLGIPTSTARSSTWVQVGTATDWVQVAAGGHHSLGLRANGTLYAWGLNYNGQLGSTTNNGSATATPTPTPVPGAYTQVAAGYYHSLGLRADGSLWAWGVNQYGQLGNTTNNGSPNNANPTPTPVAGTYTQVAAGFYHSLGLRADGTLYAWGDNTYGQLGNTTSNGPNNATPTPTLVPGIYTQVAAGQYHNLGLRADGSLWAWGINTNGQLGSTINSGTNNANPTPTPVAGTYTQVAAGYNHSLGLRANGTLYAWGYNAYGQLGSTANNGSGTANPTPTPVAGTYTQVAAGYNHSLGLQADGSLWTWGYNNSGQLGNATTSTGATPTPMATGTALVTRSLAMGYAFGLAVRGDGTLWAWGDNTYGQLGQPTVRTRLSAPIQVGTATDWVMVAAGLNHGLGLKADGTLYAWGNNNYGQLSSVTNNGTDNPNFTLVLVPGTYTQIAAGQNHSLALRADGTAWAWGNNYSGALGSTTNNGTTTATPTPTQVAGTYVQIAAGGVHSLGLQADGTLYTWGGNRYGQLGSSTNNYTTNANANPQPVAGTYVQVAGGNYHTLALGADGRLYAWGDNRYGQLGNSTNNGIFSANYTPQLVAGTYAQVAAGIYHSLGLRADGTLYTWGNNQYGQLGNDATSTGATPVPTQEVTLGTGWTTLGTGSAAYSSLVRTPSAQNFASAGSNFFGQLGDGTTTNASRFDRVSPLTSLQPLPVQLTQFEAQASGPGAVRLAWATAAEVNSARFEVERSRDGVTFARIGEVAAAGTSTTAHAYALLDAHLSAEASQLYYRLRQVDLDGTAHYSPVRVVALASPGLTLYPNPAHGGAATLLGAQPGTLATVYDALGRPVATSAPADAAGTARLALPQELAAGVYVVRAGSQALRFAVQ